MKCPTCGNQVQWEQNIYRPFCSERCKLIDLGKWVNEEYRVPGRDVSPDPVAEDQNQNENPNERGD